MFVLIIAVLKFSESNDYWTQLVLGIFGKNFPEQDARSVGWMDFFSVPNVHSKEALLNPMTRNQIVNLNLNNKDRSYQL